jgi:hypothetical protein
MQPRFHPRAISGVRTYDDDSYDEPATQVVYSGSRAHLPRGYGRVSKAAEYGGNLSALGYVPTGLTQIGSYIYERLVAGGEPPEVALRVAKKAQAQFEPSSPGFWGDIEAFIVGSLSGFAKDVATGNFSPGAIAAGIFAPSFTTLSPRGLGSGVGPSLANLAETTGGELYSEEPVGAIAYGAARGGQAVAQAQNPQSPSYFRGRPPMSQHQQPQPQDNLLEDIEAGTKFGVGFANQVGQIAQRIGNFLKTQPSQAPAVSAAPVPIPAPQPYDPSTLEIPQVYHQPGDYEAPDEGGGGEIYHYNMPEIPIPAQQTGGTPQGGPVWAQQGGGDGGNIPLMIHQTDDELDKMILREQQQDDDQDNQTVHPDQAIDEIRDIRQQMQQLQQQEQKPAPTRDIQQELAQKHRLKDRLKKLKKAIEKVCFCMTCDSQDDAVLFLNGEGGNCRVSSGPDNCQGGLPMAPAPAKPAPSTQGWGFHPPSMGGVAEAAEPPTFSTTTSPLTGEPMRVYHAPPPSPTPSQGWDIPDELDQDLVDTVLQNLDEDSIQNLNFSEPGLRASIYDAANAGFAAGQGAGADGPIAIDALPQSLQPAGFDPQNVYPNAAGFSQFSPEAQAWMGGYTLGSDPEALQN